MVVSDTTNNKTPDISDDEITYHVHSVMSNIPISQTRLNQVHDETVKDPILGKVKTYV